MMAGKKFSVAEKSKRSTVCPQGVRRSHARVFAIRTTGRLKTALRLSDGLFSVSESPCQA
ncbi:hypothetical protein [Kingella potus]|uniref:hypothetical protein n=1 Tax=Kingella potus TaxID=265175 RepID=UPI001FD3847F|nr:hypothetical protein [Kingella potus]UOP00271.1 hypothetical protein LVJ84_10175 [Kingella potus]